MNQELSELFQDAGLALGLLSLEAASTDRSEDVAIQFTLASLVATIGTSRATAAFEVLATKILSLQPPLDGGSVGDSFDESSMEHGFTEQALALQHVEERLASETIGMPNTADYIAPACDGPDGVCWTMFAVASLALNRLVAQCANEMGLAAQLGLGDAEPMGPVREALNRAAKSLRDTGAKV